MKKILSLFILLCALSAFATDVVTVTVTFTNAAGTANGDTITINGDVRTFKTTVTIPGTQILKSATAAGSTTNTFNQVALYSYPDIAIRYASATSIDFVGDPGVAMTITLSAGVGEVVSSTVTLGTGIPLRLPYTSSSLLVRTQQASAVTAYLNLTANTNAIDQDAPVAVNIVGIANDQTITGKKYLIDDEGQFWGIVSNSPAISGNIVTVTNGLWKNATIDTLSATNAKVYVAGGTFSADFISRYLQHADGGTSVDWEAGNLIDTAATISLDWETRKAYDEAGNLAFLWSTNGILIPNGLFGLKATGTNSFSDIAFRRYPITSLANGNNAGIVVGTNTFVEVSGPSGAFTINGMTGSPNRDGQLVVVVNQTGQDMTVAHQSGTDPTAANRIISLTGADRTTTGNGAATFFYSAATSRWILISFDP